MKTIEVYSVTPDGRFSKSKWYKSGRWAIKRAVFLQENNPKTHCIAIRHCPSDRTFYRFGTR